MLFRSVTGNAYSDRFTVKDGEEALYLIQALYGQNGAVICGDFSEDMAVPVFPAQEE